MTMPTHTQNAWEMCNMYQKPKTTKHIGKQIRNLQLNYYKNNSKKYITYVCKSRIIKK